MWSFRSGEECLNYFLNFCLLGKLCLLCLNLFSINNLFTTLGLLTANWAVRGQRYLELKEEEEEEEEEEGEGEGWDEGGRRSSGCL